MKYTLTILDGDHTILSTEDTMTQVEGENLFTMFDKWRKSGGTLVIAECAINDVRSVELEIAVSPTIIDSSPSSMRSASDSLRETLARQKIRSGPRVCTHEGIGLPGCPTCSPHHPYADEINAGGEAG